MMAKKSLLRIGTLIGVGLLPLGGCECEPVVFKVAPQIFVDVCASPQKKVGDKLIGGFEDCALPFGEADLSIRTSRTIVITNPSNLELKLLSVDFAPGSDPNFAFVEPPPESIGPGLSAQVAIEIRPVVEAEIQAELVIVSDANNTPKNDDGNSEIRIPITLTGVDRGVPDIEVVPVGCGTVDPLAVDFGTVATSGLQVCNIEVRNVGNRELFFDFLDFAPAEDGARTIVEPAGSNPEPGLSLTGAIPDPETPLGITSDDVPPLTLRVAFAPDVLGRYEDTLHIRSSDPDEPFIEIPIVGRGVDGPTCVARVKSVNGVDVVGAPEIEPLDDVVLTTEDSTAATPDVSIVGTVWELRERGPGSTVVLSSPNTAETGFRFANRAGVDVAGRYEACAVVTDSLGTRSVNECCVDFEAIPSDAFLVQLTWVGEPTDDMDLHVTKRDGNDRYCFSSLGAGTGGVDPPASECTSLDCNFATCRANNDTGPEWDGVPGRTDGDPRLDIDDTEGFGPENINVDLAAAGSYAFGASFFGGGVPVVMTIRLFLFGRLAGEWVETVEDDFWTVGVVHFAEDDLFSPCIEDLTDGDVADECPAFE